MLFVLQKFVTCEGRYGLVFYYHLRLLLHFFKGHELNMPFFLHNSLNKMKFTIQKSSHKLESSLYHYGLVKMLIMARLQQMGDTWDDFLQRNQFSVKDTDNNEEEIQTSGDEGNNIHMSMVYEEKITITKKEKVPF
jgi:hypothetical protein